MAESLMRPSFSRPLHGLVLCFRFLPSTEVLGYYRSSALRTQTTLLATFITFLFRLFRLLCAATTLTVTMKGRSHVARLCQQPHALHLQHKGSIRGHRLRARITPVALPGRHCERKSNESARDRRDGGSSARLAVTTGDDEFRQGRSIDQRRVGEMDPR